MLPSNFTSVGKKLYRSIPLIPVYCGLFVFIAMLSPMTWSSAGLSLFIIGGAIGIGIICTYSTTIFVHELIINQINNVLPVLPALLNNINIRSEYFAIR